MNRREALASLFLAPMAAKAATAVKTSTAGRVGYVHAMEPRSRKARVFLDGVEVTTRCYAADDVSGYVDCFQLDSDGRKFRFQNHDVARERLYGTVTIVLNSVNR